MSSCGALSFYFADLLRDQQQRFCDEDDDDAGNDQQQLPEIVFDNARLPSPLLGQQCALSMYPGALMGNGSEWSCHTRSTTSTCGSTVSGGSTHSAASATSAGSTGSNSSAGSCRWDSNPTTNKEKPAADTLLKRPKRPGRKNSDNNKHRSNKTTSSSSSSSEDKPMERPSRSNSGDNTNSNSKKSSHQLPQRPSRTSSSGNKESSRRKTTSSRGCSSPESLDKMLLQGSKQKVVSCGESDSSSDNSLKEIFRTASHQRRSASSSSSGGGVVKPLPGTRTSPPRTVNEILGQSMEELKIAW